MSFEEEPAKLIHKAAVLSVLGTTGYLFFHKYGATKDDEESKDQKEKNLVIHELITFLGLNSSLSTIYLSSVHSLFPEFVKSDDGKLHVPILYTVAPWITKYGYGKLANVTSVRKQNRDATINKKFLFASAIAAPSLLGTSMAFDLLSPNVQLRQEKLNWNVTMALFPIVSAGALIGSYSSSIPFMDFVSPRLETLGLSFYQSSLLTGLLYGVLNAPLTWIYGLTKYVTKDYTMLDSLTQTAAYTLLFPVYRYLNLKSNTSLATAIFNGMLFGLYPLTNMVTGGVEYLNEFFGVTGVLTLGIGNMFLYFLTRREEWLKNKQQQEQEEEGEEGEQGNQ